VGFNERQIKQLLQPINPKRVVRDGKGNAHVAQQDVTAHLSRIFGFGGWKKQVVSVELVFEQPGTKPNRWDVCYKALVKLTVFDGNGNEVTSFEDGSCGTALNQSRGDAHDLAYKSAISLSTKRAAKDMGDQFGLSLYNKGQTTAIVKSTLIGLEADTGEAHDVQSEVEQVVSLGNDEIDRDDANPADHARDELRSLCMDKGWDLNAVAVAFAKSNGGSLATAPEDQVRAFLNLLKSGAVKV